LFDSHVLDVGCVVGQEPRNHDQREHYTAGSQHRWRSIGIRSRVRTPQARGLRPKRVAGIEPA
jgi:hypothetical protein